MMYKFSKLDSVSLLNVRIVFLSCAFVHLLVTAIVTLSIDTTVDEDPLVRAYYYVRWKLITCWFNLITLFYLPATLYCDWRTREGCVTSRVQRLRHTTDVVFTGIIFPVTVVSDVTFWWIFLKDPDLLAPPKIFVYLPYWAQHSLHTVSLIVVILDLLLTPRRRPNSLKPRVALLMAFSIIYIGMVYHSILKGEYVYVVCRGWSSAYFFLVAISSLAFTLAVFALQWTAIDFFWGTPYDRKIINKD